MAKNNLCARCGEKPRSRNREICWDCETSEGKAKGRRKRATYSERDAATKKKDNARSMLRTYVRRGKVIPRPCEYQVEDGVYCLEKKVEGHHHLGYDYPLIATWYCREHHLKVHEEEGYDHENMADGSNVGGKAFDAEENARKARMEVRRKKRRPFTGRKKR